MNLCTVINKPFIRNCKNLIKSYELNSYAKNIFVYYFDCEEKDLEELRQATDLDVTLIKIPKVSDFIYEPRGIGYKVYAIWHCLNNFGSMIYSDSANCFIKKFTGFQDILTDGRLFLPYTHSLLYNKYWCTRKSLEAMECTEAANYPQYWAGFQVYSKTPDNIKFVNDYYRYSLDKEACLPDTTVKQPDGPEGCREHRQDQSIYSVLIHKHSLHQNFNLELQRKFGDWSTFQYFDRAYEVLADEIILSARESKHGHYRYDR